jgi:hypothetical protein
VGTRRSLRRLGGLWAGGEMVDVNSVNSVDSFFSFFLMHLCNLAKGFAKWHIGNGEDGFLNSLSCRAP